MTVANEPAEPKPSPTRVLINYFATAYHLVTHEGRAYAIPGRSEAESWHGPEGVAQPVGSLRNSVFRAVPRLPGVKGLVGRGVVDTVIEYLKSIATETGEVPLALRFRHDPNEPEVILDLGRDDGAVVMIWPDSWEIVDRPPDGVYFRRSHATRPLPTPVRRGRLDELAELLALDPEGEVFRALLGWVISLPFSASVRSGLLLTGPPGTGKSTRLRLAASIVEPSGVDALGSSFGHNHDDDLVRAAHRAVPLFDNLSSVSGDTSDVLCGIITGAGREKRALYTDDTLHTVAIRRPVALTAVAQPAGLRSDALDRLITLDMPPIPARTDDAEIQRRFDAAHPRLLGALLDAVSAVLHFVDRVDPPTGYRMASHARILAAVDAATGAGELEGCPGGLLDAYGEVTRQTKKRSVSDDSFGAAVIALLENAGEWSGRPGELIAAAGRFASVSDHAAGWPRSPRAVPGALAHLKAGLAELGVTWQERDYRGKKYYFFTLCSEAGS